MIGSARIFYCALCHTQVVICSYCDRGQIYCSQTCSQTARTVSCRAAGRRYQNSYRGRLNHAARQRHYSDQQRDKKEKVTHQGSHEPRDYDLLSEGPDNIETDTMHCHFCKRPVGLLLRRGFLNCLADNSTTRTANWTRAP